MGEGTFAKVLECHDNQHGRRVAIKIIRSIQKYTDSAQVEIEILNDIKRFDPNNTSHCVRLIDSFMYRGHMCLVFPLYGLSLYEFIKRNDYRGFSLEHVRKFAYNLLTAINFLHNKMELIHTDLKPENILLIDSDYYIVGGHNKVPKCTEISVIDFGSATFESQHHTSIISTRHYRAPEVILGIGWSYPADIWSIGCIIVELYTGDALFQTHENREHLALMEKILGPLPDSLVRRASDQGKKYFQNNKLRWPEIASSKQSVEFVEQTKVLALLCDASENHSDQCNYNDLFYDLVKKMLSYEPSDRITARQALEHAFFEPLRLRSDQGINDQRPI
jgi:dual-specificity kinase